MSRFLNSLLLSLLIMSILTSCLNTDFEPSEWAIDPQLDFSKSTVLFNSVLSSDSVIIATNYQSFEVKSDQNWCSVSIDREKSAVEIKVSPNMNLQQRTAIVTVSISRGNKSLSKNISVVQMGGVWESVGNFNVYWGYQISDTQKVAVVELLENMIHVTGGDFVMGNSDNQVLDTTHPHLVTLSSFYIGKFEVTQKQWRAIMGNNSSFAKGDSMPIYNISWAEAFEFTTRLSNLTNLNVQLPTEAQWEYAARGGSQSKGYIYSGSDDVSEIAVYNTSTYSQEPSIVGSLMANEIGLYDMSGNVAEYCFDWWESDYEDPNKKDPIGPNTGQSKVVRGGHINSFSPVQLRSTCRFLSFSSFDNNSTYSGFRIVISDETK